MILVIGKRRVPQPATGMIAFVIILIVPVKLWVNCNIFVIQ